MNDDLHIQCHKSWFDLEVFNEQIYSDFQAYIWLNCKAYTKDSTRNISGKKIKINRGELYVGARELKQTWRWGHSRISEFLKELERCSLVNLSQRCGFTIIKITNYNKEQGTDKLSHESMLYFDVFWKEYLPIHTSKGSKKVAKSAYAKALKIAEPDAIMQGLGIYMKQCKANNTYTKAVSTWLNQEMWEVESTEDSNVNSYIDEAYQRMMLDKNKEK